MRIGLAAWVRSLLLTAAAAGLPAPASAALFQVHVEQGTRTTTAGDTVRYALYVPVAAAGQPVPPWPVVILTHGFARSGARHALNAFYLAQRGVIVLTPDMVDLLGGEPAQLRNIANTVDHVRWLKGRGVTPGDVLAARVDAQRIALAGHSAGGSVSLEAALDAVAAGDEIAALVLLDAVPWPRTAARVASLPPLSYAALRSEPGPCNAFGSGAVFSDAPPVPVDEITIVGATHCDPENPSDLLCAIGCGGITATGTTLYQRLLYVFLKDRLAITPADGASDTFDATVDSLVATGAVTRRSRGPSALPRFKVNGVSPVSDVVATTGPVRVTLDVFANAAREPLEWYLAAIQPAGVSWFTPAGLSAVPAPLLAAAPAQLRNAPFADIVLDPGTSIGFALVFVRAGRLVSVDVIFATRPDAARAGGQ